MAESGNYQLILSKSHPFFCCVAKGIFLISPYTVCKRQHLNPFLQLLWVISPLLHHYTPFFQEFRPAVRRTECIWHLVGKLVLDDFGADVEFFGQDSTGHGAEAVAGNFSLGVVAHAA